MKKLLPLIIIFAVLFVVGGKLLLAKQYCLLCLIKGYDAGVSAPGYFTDTFVTVLPSLY
jgi:hypothetical protein